MFRGMNIPLRYNSGFARQCKPYEYFGRVAFQATRPLPNLYAS